MNSRSLLICDAVLNPYRMFDHAVPSEDGSKAFPTVTCGIASMFDRSVKVDGEIGLELGVTVDTYIR